MIEPVDIHGSFGIRAFSMLPTCIAARILDTACKALSPTIRLPLTTPSSLKRAWHAPKCIWSTRRPVRFLERTTNRSPVVPENHVRTDSCDEAESAHDPMRCVRSSICLGRLSATCSRRLEIEYLFLRHQLNIACLSRSENSADARCLISAPRTPDQARSGSVAAAPRLAFRPAAPAHRSANRNGLEIPARTRITAVFSMPSFIAIVSAVLKPMPRMSRRAGRGFPTSPGWRRNRRS